MQDKAENHPKKNSPPPLLQWRFHFLTTLLFAAMVLVWSIDSRTIRTSIEAWNLKRQQYLAAIMINPQPTKFPDFAAAPATGPLPLFQEWMAAELEPNFTAGLLSRWLGRHCSDEQTAEIVIPDMDGRGTLELTAGDIHRFVFHAVGESNHSRCSGGDYFESDLSGDRWKTRPPIEDLGNGSYVISLQVHPDFVGEFELTLLLLFRGFQGIKMSPNIFAVDKKLRKLPIRFVGGHSQLPPLQICDGSDFERDLWVGRWTRHGKNDDCKISDDGRFRCLPPDFPCETRWCNGKLGTLESNGWVYSAHCSFKLFRADSAWNCLNNRWIFFTGDSNHVDSIRNLLNFVLNVTDVDSVTRRFDLNFTNPNDATQSVRITSIFNGHWNATKNGLGLDSFRNEGFKNLIKGYFTSEPTVPDTIIINSGLHDGVHWMNVKRFAEAADGAARFWKGVIDTVTTERGLAAPRMFYRTTVAPGGGSRVSALNPNKMEVFNWIVLEKFRRAGLLAGVVDNFDMTFPWHFDYRCTDGAHYGRRPAKEVWKDGEIGHHYFVDLMLVHVLLNVLCLR